MLSQARADRASPSRRPPVPAAADETKDVVQDLLGGTGRQAGAARFQILDQEVKSLPIGDLPDEQGAAGTLPQEMAYELPVLPPGELRSEEALDDFVREVLIRHVIHPRKKADLH
jgi:hypothetical protein